MSWLVVRALREIAICVVGLLGMVVGVLHDLFRWLDEVLERWFIEMSDE